MQTTYRYLEWIDFMKSQGIAVDKENHYDGDITDFMAAVDVMESILKRLHKEREELRETDAGHNKEMPV